MAEPLTSVQQIEMKIAQLQEMLLANHPQMPMLLKEIHKRLATDADLSHMISLEERGVIVAALSKHTQTYIVEDLLSAKIKGRKKDYTGLDLGMGDEGVVPKKHDFSNLGGI